VNRRLESRSRAPFGPGEQVRVGVASSQLRALRIVLEVCSWYKRVGRLQVGCWRCLCAFSHLYCLIDDDLAVTWSDRD
jgi:hypothetical protein